MAALLFAMPMWLIFQSSSIALSLAGAIMAKVAISVVMSMAIVPVVILASLADVRQSRQPSLARCSI
jgi:hypothetical protein